MDWEKAIKELTSEAAQKRLAHYAGAQAREQIIDPTAF